MELIKEHSNIPEWYYVGDWDTTGEILPFDVDPSADGGFGERYNNLRRNKYFYWPSEDKESITYVLEVVRFIHDRKEWMKRGSKQEHVGYMRAHFRTKKDAASYYDRHNSHMRGLNAHNTWQSDCDPNTNLLYIVRVSHNLSCTISPFDPNDEPTFDMRGSGMYSSAPFLK